MREMRNIASCYFPLLHVFSSLSISLFFHFLEVTQMLCVSFQLRKQIRNIEIAWPLGAMFDVYGMFKRISN